MSKPFKHVSIFLFIMAISIPAMAQDWQYPVIKEYGGVVAYENAVMKPKKNEPHKILFHITSAAKKEGVNDGLWHIARLVNLFGLSEVPRQNVHIAAVISGAATDMVMTNKAYRQKYGTANPNMALLKALHNYGVKIYVCGQAVAEHGIRPKTEINKYTTLTLSALIDIPYLQRKGYQLMK